MKSLKLLFFFLLGTTTQAHDYIPGPKQDHPIVLVDGNLYTVSGPVLNETDILFESGRIIEIGKDLTPPAKCEVININGMNVYPGLIAAGTTLGLTEIGAVRATNDIAEVGDCTPEVKAHIAYNPDSEIIPTVRSNGITTAQIVPGGAMLTGQSCIMNLDGWTKEDAAVRLVDGIHLVWPQVAVQTAWWESRTPEEQRKDMKKARDELRKNFEDARAYFLTKEVDPSLSADLRWEAMLPLFTGDLPLFVHADDYRQIEQAVRFVRKLGIRMILVGGKEAWKLTDLLKENDIPVVYGDVHSMPMRPDDSYDNTFRIPYQLAKAGVEFCIGVFHSWGTRNLPFQAGQTVAFGLDRNVALRSITLSAAEILGLAEELGSLDVGKRATIIISTGDIMDPLTHQVTHMFIDGRRVDLDNKHKELYRKYQSRSAAR